ncbi:hypothetical protein [Algivirga pacifica]|uniref:Lipoprotein n=1 Tax=Algivirga pacifica TaxID=1162670 RepID=A0ABP9DCQ3_9BACT
MFNKLSIYLTVLLLLFSCRNKKEDLHAVEIKDQRVHDIVNDVINGIKTNVILKLTLRSSNHTPFDLEYDWLLVYVEPIISSEQLDIEDKPPIAYSYINNTLILIYTDVEFVVSPSSTFLSSLKAAIDKEVLSVDEMRNIPPNRNHTFYRYEYCNQKLSKKMGNIFPPDMIPECAND